MFLKRMNKTQLLAFVRKNDVTTVYMNPCKLVFSEYNSFPVQLTVKDSAIVDLKYNKSFEDIYNAWAYYNTSWEQGYYAHYYVAVEWEWQTQTHTALGWESVDYNITAEDAQRSLQEYRDNMPQYRHRLIKRLVSFVYS